MCVQGDYFSCRKGPAVLFGVGLDGGMAQQILVPPRAIVPLPNNVRAADACLVEPLAVAVHGISMLKLTPQSRVAIIGAGAVGLAATAVLSTHLKTVHVAARHDAQKEAVEKLGAGLAPEGEYDAVIECAGNSAAMAQAARLCKPGGTIILLATYWEAVTMPAADISLKSLTVKGSFLYGSHGLVRDVEVAAQLMAARPELKDILITHRIPLEAAPEAFAIARDRQAGAIKVVLEP
jgi:threonine dehydrogenase-like Zn-dependent dehydrogenase